ncbi:hypothetical protein [Paenisporosarcina sp.]|uniref:hypothetical protein n=1 Tax=Paenisporosarcina sp. TaxID=1932001 RepID=UPI003C71735E
MITLEDLSILNVQEFKEENSDFIIREKDNNFIMELSVNSVEKKIFNVFSKKTNGKKQNDNSKLIFLSFLNFPDGVYLEVEDSLIKCHIFELKKTPVSSTKLNLICKQFLSAKFHLISLLSIIEIDMSKVEFLYYVAYVNDIEKRDRFNLTQPRKVVSGESVSTVRHIEDWLNSKLELKLGRYIFSEEISKIQMDHEQNIDGIDIYRKETVLL